jgi:uncharacterized protein
MAEHPNATLIRRAVEAFNRGEPGQFVALLDEDAILHLPGRTTVAGTYRGQAEVGRLFWRLAERTEGAPHFELLHLLTSGDEYVVAIWRAHWRRRRDEQEQEWVEGYVYRLRNGRIVEGRHLLTDPERVAEFWAP